VTPEVRYLYHKAHKVLDFFGKAYYHFKIRKVRVTHMHSSGISADAKSMEFISAVGLLSTNRRHKDLELTWHESESRMEEATM